MECVTKVYEDSDMIKSKSDKKHYRGLELSNGMKILLISDPETDKSSMAMDVHIGHMKDPVHLPGLAHFCEHMLFLGTEKYPEENEYDKYLSEHGGASNAFTSTEHTNFYFDVAPDDLRGAVDRFAQFFTHPLFTASATEREVNAVDSENSGNIHRDSRRMVQLEKSLAIPGHDYAKFGTGNKQTLDTEPAALGVNVRQELLDFHSRFYSSNVMGCCVLGREDVDTLQEMAVPLLAEVLDKQVETPEWDTPPYTQAELRRVVRAVPIKDIREMCVWWPTPDVSDHYKAMPDQYLGYLIGHEGKGSILSELKARGWANTLTAGESYGARGFSFFCVQVDLTDAGEEHVDDIVSVIYQYIHLLEAQGYQEWVFRECQNLAAMAFHFKGKEDPDDYTSDLSGMLQDYPIPDVLRIGSLFDEFREDLIDSIQKRLVPDNMMMTIASKKFEGQTDQTEPWYGTEFSVTPFTPDQLSMWANCGLHNCLHLPQQNEFIPSNFDLVEREPEVSQFPVMIVNTSLSRLWFKQDSTFLEPKACVSLDLMNPLAYMDPLHSNLCSMFSDLFDDALTEYSYAADIAGLTYSFDDTYYGMSLKVKGYNDKLPPFLATLVESLTQFAVKPERLAIYKDLQLRSLKDFHAKQPNSQASFYTRWLTSEVLFTHQELLQALQDVTPARMEVFIKDLLSKVHIEGLVYGNVTRSQAVSMLQSVEDTLHRCSSTRPLSPLQCRRFREYQLPAGASFLYKEKNSVHDTSCVEVYYQCGRQSTEANVVLELFCQVISEPCYNILRTREQLGYSVHSGPRFAKGVLGVKVSVQSAKSPAYVEGRIEAFMLHVEDIISQLTPADLDRHISAVATRRLEKAKSLREQNGRYWVEVTSKLYNFDRDALEVMHLRTLTKDDLCTFYKDKIAVSAPNRRKLCIHVASDKQNIPNSNRVLDVECNGNDTMNDTMDDSDASDGSESEKEMPPPVEPLTKDELLPVPTLPVATEITDVMAFKRDLFLYPVSRPCINIPAVTS